MILLALLGAALAGPALGQSPHGDPNACAACHAAPAAGQTVGAPLPIVATCRSCHPTADMHPVGMKPNKVQVAAGWPLEDGAVTCATCHAEPAHGGPAAALLAPYHRGGPYQNTLQFCNSCHDTAALTRSNPHGAGRDPQSPTCTACHAGAPAAGAGPGEARTRLPVSEACTNCHPGPIHAGVPEHLGKSLSPAVRASLPPQIAVNNDGTIACWTCHEVHDGGAAGHPSNSPLASGLRALTRAGQDSGLLWPDADPALLALPIDDGALCRACHGEGP